MDVSILLSFHLIFFLTVKKTTCYAQKLSSWLTQEQFYLLVCLKFISKPYYLMYKAYKLHTNQVVSTEL